MLMIIILILMPGFCIWCWSIVRIFVGHRRSSDNPKPSKKWRRFDLYDGRRSQCPTRGQGSWWPAWTTPWIPNKWSQKTYEVFGHLPSQMCFISNMWFDVTFRFLLAIMLKRNCFQTSQIIYLVNLVCKINAHDQSSKSSESNKVLKFFLRGPHEEWSIRRFLSRILGHKTKALGLCRCFIFSVHQSKDRFLLNPVAWLLSVVGVFSW